MLRPNADSTGYWLVWAPDGLVFGPVQPGVVYPSEGMKEISLFMDQTSNCEDQVGYFTLSRAFGSRLTSDVEYPFSMSNDGHLVSLIECQKGTDPLLPGWK